MHTAKCVVLVPVGSSIIPAVDQSLRELERRGYTVWRVYGFSAIDQGRCKLAYDALHRCGFEEIMWIDADVGFNPDDVDRIRAHNLPICCGIYPAKGWPVMTSQFFSDAAVHFGDQGSLHEIAFAATGFLYTKKEVYDTIVDKLHLPGCVMWGDQPIIPWFLPMVVQGSNGTNYYLGEDYAFCYRARQAGFSIVADTTIRLQHWGSYSYQWEDVLEGKQAPLPSVELVPNIFTSSQAPERVLTGNETRSHTAAADSAGTILSVVPQTSSPVIGGSTVVLKPVNPLWALKRPLQKLRSSDVFAGHEAALDALESALNAEIARRKTHHDHPDMVK